MTMRPTWSVPRGRPGRTFAFALLPILAKSWIGVHGKGHNDEEEGKAQVLLS